MIALSAPCGRERGGVPLLGKGRFRVGCKDYTGRGSILGKGEEKRGVFIPSGEKGVDDLSNSSEGL